MLHTILGKRWGGATGRLSRLGGLILAAAIIFVLIPRVTGGTPPLVADVQPMGGSACQPAPNRAGGMLTWNTLVGFGFPTFLNPSRSAVTVESVALMDPHDLTVHGGFVYEMEHRGTRPAPLYVVAPVTAMASMANPVAWAHRQPVPGAIIPPGGQTTRYQIVPEFTADSPAGGWATGEVVRYEANGHQYTLDAELGVTVADSHQPGACAAMYQAIQKAWQSLRHVA